MTPIFALIGMILILVIAGGILVYLFGVIKPLSDNDQQPPQSVG
jgi:hypothetical protein